MRSSFSVFCGALVNDSYSVGSWRGCCLDVARDNRDAVMQATNSRLVLSPSDLNDHVECAYLTSLALEVARGTRPHPWVPEDHGDLLRRKGAEHEAAYLADLRGQGRQVVDVVGADRWNFDA